MNNKKKLFIALLTSIAIIFAQFVGIIQHNSLITATGNDYEAYDYFINNMNMKNSTTGEIFHAYCMNHNRDSWMDHDHHRGDGDELYEEWDYHTGSLSEFFTTGQLSSLANNDRDAFMDRLKTIMYYGYPYDAAGLREKYGLSEYEFITATQRAIWVYTNRRIQDPGSAWYDCYIELQNIPLGTVPSYLDLNLLRCTYCIYGASSIQNAGSLMVLAGTTTEDLVSGEVVIAKRDNDLRPLGGARFRITPDSNFVDSLYIQDFVFDMSCISITQNGVTPSDVVVNQDYIEFTSSSDYDTVLSNIPLGRYNVTEISLPNGCSGSENSTMVVYSDGNGGTCVSKIVSGNTPVDECIDNEFYVYNEVTSNHLSINKSFTGDYSNADVVFNLYDSADQLVGTFDRVGTTNEYVYDGILYDANDAQNYVIREESTPDGFIPADDINIEVLPDSTINVTGYEDLDHNANSLSINVENEAVTNIIYIGKVFTGTVPTGEVEFAIFDADDNEVGSLSRIREENNYSFTGVLLRPTEATYTIREISTPAGYIAAEDITITVATDGTISVDGYTDTNQDPLALAFTVENVSVVNLITVEKTFEDGANITDTVAFELRHGSVDGDVVGALNRVGTTQTYAYEGSLALGVDSTYYLVETAAPSGFVASEPICISVAADGTITSVADVTGVSAVVNGTDATIRIENARVTPAVTPATTPAITPATTPAVTPATTPVATPAAATPTPTTGTTASTGEEASINGVLALAIIILSGAMYHISSENKKKQAAKYRIRKPNL